jgi:hypothetical protein
MKMELNGMRMKSEFGGIVSRAWMIGLNFTNSEKHRLTEESERRLSDG